MKKGLSLFALLIIYISGVFAQSNPDDFWLNNGFTDGDTVTTNSGYFYDDGGNGDYTEGPSWNVRFCSENGEPITLDFSGFATHYDGPPAEGDDYISINYPAVAPGYIAYHDDTPVFSFTSQSSCIDFGFNTDGDGNVHSGWVAEIYAIPAPFNNDPADAEILTVGNVCSPSYYSNKGAYNSTGLESPPCKEYFGGDVWFRLTVPSTGVVKIETFAGTLNYAILDIYSSTNSTITDGERITCVDDGGVMPSVTLNRPPGETLYIRLFGEQAKSGLFGICASDPSSPVTGYTGPGGVGDSVSIDFWYKPEIGVLNASGLPAGDGEQVETWSDQSGNDKHLVQATVGLQAEYTANLINNTGGMAFDGNDLFEVESGSGDAPLHWFAAGAFVGSQRQTMISIGDANINKTASLSKHSDQDYFSFTTSDRYGPPLTDSEYYIFHASHETNSQYHFLELNGAIQTVDAVPSALETDGSVQIGTSWDDTDPFYGNISEIIQYRKSLNEAQSIIVNNYLAAKYNISPGANNFYNWTNSYHYDVAGIGRVDMNNIHTKAESAGILAISGADDLDDGEFLLFGHDNGDFTTWSSANVPVGDTNIVRLDRLWRVDIEGGDPGTVSISIEKAVLPSLPAGFIAYNIYVDADGDFSSGASAFGPFEIGSELVINNISLNDGDYLAVAAVRPVLEFVSNVSEELESVSNPTIEVQLNYAISNIVELDYIVSGGTAVQGTDYSLLPSSISINPGLKTGNIIPLIIEDTIPEIPDEYFDIDISSSTAGITIGNYSTNRHTILNNDLEVNAYYISDSIRGECTSSTTDLRVEAIGTGPFTYSWSPAGSLDVSDNDTVAASPTTTTLYTVEVTDGFAQTKSDTIRVTVIPAPATPLVTVNGSDSFCDGDSVNLSTTSGFAAYEWSTLETSDNIWVKTSGSYNVTVTDTFGCESPVSSAAVITVNTVPDPPAVTIDGPSSFCDGDSVILIAESGYSTYLWSDMSTNDSLTVKTTDNYYLTATVGNVCSSKESDTIAITVFSNPPIPTISPDGVTTFCAGNSVKLSAPAGYASYYWSSTETTEEIYASISGNYNVIVTDSNACYSEVSLPVLVTVHNVPDKPTIDTVGSLSFCDGGSVTLEGVSAESIFTWSDGFSGQSRLVETSGDFALRVKNSDGCLSEFSDSITVEEYPVTSKPIITVTGLLEFCEGDSSTLSAPAGLSAYMWSDGSTNDAIFVKTTGTHDVYVTDANGCDSELSDPVEIQMNPRPATAIVSPLSATTFCEGGSVDLMADQVYNSYIWSDGGTGQTNNITSTGNYYLVGEDADGCRSGTSNKVDVFVNEVPGKPVITADGPLYLITGDSVTLSAPISTAYTWSPGGEITQDILITTSGDFSVVVDNSYGCSSVVSDIVTVTVSDFLLAPVVNVAGSLQFCEGGEVSLAGPDGFTAYTWSDGATGQELTINESGTFSLIVTDGDGHTSLPSDDIIVQVFELPVLSLVSTTEPLCFGDENGDAQVGSTGGAPPYTYTWNDSGGNDEMLNNVAAGSYAVSVQDQNYCSDNLELIIDQPEQIVIESIITPAYCPDFIDGALDLSIEGGLFPYTVVWGDGGNEEYFDNLGPGNYTYTVNDANNCEVTGSAEVTYTNEVCFEIPEVITPNGDTYNEYWLIEGLEVYPNVVIEVFDRWGKRVFYSEGHDVFFDGTFNGKELPMESYHYIIDLNNGADRIVGNITILR